MDLIERQAAMDCCFKPQVRPNAEIFNALKMAISSEISAIQSVPAVPLDKLCEWLNVHCGKPNYCNDRLCGECNLDGEGFEYETCWETLLTEWMEGLDAAD